MEFLYVLVNSDFASKATDLPPRRSVFWCIVGDVCWRTCVVHLLSRTQGSVTCC